MSEMRTSPPDLLVLLDRLADLWLTYIKSQLLLSLIIGGLTWTAGSAIGLPWAFGLGMISGILEMIRNLGPLIGTVLAVIVALWKGSTVIPVDNWVFALIVIAVYVVIQQAVEFLIAPRLLGKRLDLPPLLVLFAVIVGALVAGVPGAYLAVPLIASMREIVRFIAAKHGGSSPQAKGQ